MCVQYAISGYCSFLMACKHPFVSLPQVVSVFFEEDIFITHLKDQRWILWTKGGFFGPKVDFFESFFCFGQLMVNWCFGYLGPLMKGIATVRYIAQVESQTHINVCPKCRNPEPLNVRLFWGWGFR